MAGCESDTPTYICVYLGGGRRREREREEKPRMFPDSIEWSDAYVHTHIHVIYVCIHTYTYVCIRTYTYVHIITTKARSKAD